jgi:hypothetical protein
MSAGVPIFRGLMTKSINILLTCLLLAWVNHYCTAQLQPPPRSLAEIKEADLKKDLYALASDHFRGREFGTEDELKAAVWLAEQARLAGIQPAGDDGTFFQFFNLQRHRISPLSTVTINDRSLPLWSDVLIGATAQTSLDAEVVVLDKATTTDIEKANLEGKIVAFIPGYDSINLNVSFPERRFVTGLALRKYLPLLTRKKAAGVIFIVADDFTERAWTEHVHVSMKRGRYQLYDKELSLPGRAEMPVFWVRKKDIPLTGSGVASRIKVNIFTESFLYPSVNVIGKIEGTDPVLKKEYVIISGHTDHMGVRETQNGDSIYNGADDNASACAAVLGVARAFRKHPAKRSQLFIFFGAEEPYLFGSAHYSHYPTVPLKDIVAVLNADMIGRNSPDSVAILGTNGKQEVSKLLTKLAMEANAEGPKFLIDTAWDSPSHPEGFFYRSDHASMVRVGVPSIFFTSVLHPTYHTPKDEAQFIDYKKLKKITELMYRVGWKVSNLAERPVMNPEFRYRNGR